MLSSEQADLRGWNGPVLLLESDNERFYEREPMGFEAPLSRTPRSIFFRVRAPQLHHPTREFEAAGAPLFSTARTLPKRSAENCRTVRNPTRS